MTHSASATSRMNVLMLLLTGWSFLAGYQLAAVAKEPVAKDTEIAATDDVKVPKKEDVAVVDKGDVEKVEPVKPQQGKGAGWLLIRRRIWIRC